MTDILETSPHALVVDLWTKNKGKALAESSELLLTNEEWADCFAACFEPRPKLAERCADGHRSQWFADMLSTDNWKVMNRSTRGNVLASMVAAQSIAEDYAKCLDEGDDSAPSASRAAGNASGRVRDANDALAAISGVGGGCGGLGPNPSTEGVASAMAVFNAVKDDRLLTAIVRSAGKLRRMARSLQRRKVTQVPDDTVGIEPGSNISRLCMMERALIGVEELELLQLYRLTSGATACRQLEGKEPVGKGPIVIIVDESGSMGFSKHASQATVEASKIATAKGLALAMAWVANSQGRWAALVGFAGGSDGNVLMLPPGNWPEPDVMTWLAHFYGGGTTLDVPVKELPEKLWQQFINAGAPRGKTDVVLVTDAVVKCPAAMATNYTTWAKAEAVTTYGIVVGEPSVGDMELFCDVVKTVATIDPMSPEIQSILSI